MFPESLFQSRFQLHFFPSPVPARFAGLGDLSDQKTTFSLPTLLLSVTVFPNSSFQSLLLALALRYPHSLYMSDLAIPEIQPAPLQMNQTAPFSSQRRSSSTAFFFHLLLFCFFSGSGQLFQCHFKLSSALRDEDLFLHNFRKIFFFVSTWRRAYPGGSLKVSTMSFSQESADPLLCHRGSSPWSFLPGSPCLAVFYFHLGPCFPPPPLFCPPFLQGPLMDSSPFAATGQVSSPFRLWSLFFRFSTSGLNGCSHPKNISGLKRSRPSPAPLADSLQLLGCPRVLLFIPPPVSQNFPASS